MPYFSIVLVFIFLTLGVFGEAYSQVSIEGRIIDTESMSPIPSSIVSCEGKAGDIMAYTTTDSLGRFSININTEDDSVSLEVSNLGYHKLRKKVSTKAEFHELKLDLKDNYLDEVIVKPDPVVELGDTVVYDPKQFKKLGDRSIGDVLENMPGIDIDTEGKVRFQGRPIKHLYVDNLDLLGGKYALAHQSLPSEAVRLVEVYKNHQDKKVLSGYQKSEDVSLNLQLEDGLNFVGKAKAGLGVSPLLWDGELSPMVFKKNQQSMSSLKANNIGKPLSSRSLRDYFSEQSIEFSNPTLTKPYSFVDAIQAKEPPLDLKNWLTNEDYALETNFLKKNGNKSSRLNVAAFRTSSIQSSDRFTGIGLSEREQIGFREEISNQSSHEKLNLQYQYELNENEKYINQVIELNYSGRKDSTTIGRGAQDFFQVQSMNRLQTYYAANRVTNWKKGLLEFRVKGKYFVHPERLTVIEKSEGLNQGLRAQEIDEMGYESMVAASYKFRKRRLTYTVSSGFLLESKKMASLNFQESIEQKLRRRNFNVYTKGSIQYTQKSLWLKVDLPLQYYTLETKAKVNDISQSGFPFLPSFSLYKGLGGLFDLKVTFSRNLRWNEPIDQLTSGLLASYRKINIGTENLLYKKSSEASINLKYDNLVNGYYGSILYSLSDNYTNYRTQTEASPEGFLIKSFSLTPNRNHTQSLMLRGEKTSYEHNLTLGLFASLVRARNRLLLNGFLQNQSNTTQLLECKIDYDPLSNFRISSTYRYNSFSNSLIRNTTVLNTFSIEGRAGLGDFLEFSTKGDFQKAAASLPVQSILNLQVSMKPKKEKYRIELSLRNIFNNKRYVTADVIEEAQMTERSFLRPRQLMVSFEKYF